MRKRRIGNMRAATPNQLLANAAALRRTKNRPANVLSCNILDVTPTPSIFCRETARSPRANSNQCKIIAGLRKKICGGGDGPRSHPTAPPHFPADALPATRCRSPRELFPSTHLVFRNLRARWEHERRLSQLRAGLQNAPWASPHVCR